MACQWPASRADHWAWHGMPFKHGEPIPLACTAQPKNKAIYSSWSEKTLMTKKTFLKRTINGWMPICEAFARIEQQPNIYDVVHVKYFDESFITIKSLLVRAYLYKMVCPWLFQFPASVQIATMTHDREDKKVGVGSLMAKAVTPPLPPGSLYMEEVHVKVICCVLGEYGAADRKFSATYITGKL
ncbi:hypothetical protein Dsin_007512 [Dipteronia sinensis]|uniref:Uncharacterized protein n=1 Tax=Dipteronia sinensis TaxID=43782 RepID=A0AAE0EIH2_9ROSI|nr:hypothetical protein Dsin_007512 [Dipteronia sinensis]